MKNITVISGYYYPEDTAIGLYNTQLVEYLEDKGYNINVVTGFPSYPQWKIRDDYKNKKAFLLEKHGLTKIYRYKQYVPSTPTFFKRILLLLDFTFGSFINVLKIKECDVVISVVPHTSTILLGWILKKRRNAKLWNHIQDFEFDAALESGVSKKPSFIKKLVFKMLFRIEKSLLNHADLNSTISYNMLDKLTSKSCKSSFYFPNWIDNEKIDPTNSEQHDYLRASTFKILYSGNIGDKQDWDFFLLFAKKLKDYNVDIILVGDGAQKSSLCKKIQDFKNITYYEPVKYEELSSLLCSADLHILFQKNDVIDSVMPSKLLGMMASAKPSLITGNRKSEVRKVIKESKGGFYVIDNDITKCISAVDNLINSRTEVLNMGKNAREYVINKFSKNEVLSRFETKLSQTLKE